MKMRKILFLLNFVRFHISANELRLVTADILYEVLFIVHSGRKCIAGSNSSRSVYVNARSIACTSCSHIMDQRLLISDKSSFRSFRSMPEEEMKVLCIFA
jgi:hypothetical protein